MQRVRNSHLYLSHAFQSLPPGPLRGERQSVLQNLRWDPIEGLQIDLQPTEGQDPPNPTHGRWQPGERLWRMVIGPGGLAWLQQATASTLSKDGLHGDLHSGQFHFVEIASHVPLGALPREQITAVLAEAARYKSNGGRGLFSGNQDFYWSVSYHLARPVAGTLVGDIPLAERWHAEGGRYHRHEDGVPSDIWMRRTSSMRDDDSADIRFGDNFDPKASYRFQGLKQILASGGLNFATGPKTALPMLPFVIRLGKLLASEGPMAGEPALTPKGAARLAVSYASALPLNAWYKPVGDELVMTWDVSPPMRFAATTGSIPR